MDRFSYLSVLISIILGLGITQLVTGLGRLIQARRRVRMYWPTIAWTGLLLLIHVQTWWAMFGLRNQTDWSFAQFFVVLLQPIVLSLLAALVLPDINADTHADLRENYYTQSRWFFSLTFLLLVVSLTKDVVLSGSLPAPLNVATHVAFMLLALGGVATRHERYHQVMAPATIALVIAYIGVLFGRLQ
jgi:hypothetical protein